MKTFSLVNAPHLPVTGESHPLTKESTRWLTTGNAVALLGALMIFGALYLWSQLNPPEPPVVVIPAVVPWDEYRPTPPRIVPETPRDTGPKPPVTPRELAIPEPVDDNDALASDFPTLDDWSKMLDDRGISDGPVYVAGSSAAMLADTIVAFDELPVLLSITAPVYPELVRQAGIDGTVLVKVLVARSGKVKQAVAVEGPEVLYASAVNAARTALFAPAKQNDTPVDVWVVIPVTFTLNR